MIPLLVTAALAASLEADIRAAAALPGEPSIVSAAGVTSDEQPILTIENPWALDPASKRRRAVIYAGAGSERQAAAAIAIVKWFKTSAPASLRESWALSVLPSAAFDPQDTKSLDRWTGWEDVWKEQSDYANAPIAIAGH